MVSASDTDPAPWAWPLPVDLPAITGTFMESRQGGYHAGLDLRTEGRIGLPVRSPVDGWVSRVRTSPRGYGKGLYVQSDDGQTLVFAHLSRFHAPVQDLLRSAMQRSGRYDQDLHCDPGAIPVRRGEVIALSGDSGTGAPHLHLEVRDGAGRPQNPQRWLAVPDTVAPTVRALRLVPLGAGTPFAWPTPSISVEAVPDLRLGVRGRFALHVDVRDATGYAPFSVAPLGVVLRVDGEEYYRVEQRSFDFDQSGQIHLEIEREGERRWLRLHRRAGMEVPGRTGPGAAIEVGDRARDIEVEVYDHAGRRGHARMVLDPHLPPFETAQAAAPLTVEEDLVHLNTLGRDGARLFNGERAIVTAGEGPRRVVDLAALECGPLTWVDGADTLAVTWVALGGRPFGPLRLPGTTIEFSDREGNAAHAGGALVVETIEAGVPAATRAVSPVLRLKRVAWAVRAGLEVAAPVDPGRTHVVWMQRSGRDWAALPTEFETRASGGQRWARARVREAGDLVLAEDRSDPRIEVPAAAALELAERSVAGPHGLPQPRWPELRIAITDRGAGIGDRAPELLVDGRPHPAVWDPEREVLLLDWFVDPGPGRHSLEIRAVDQAGRQSVRRLAVRLVPRR